MNSFSLDNSSDLPVGGRKGKTCSMSGCNNTHQRYPNMSFFRFPKELARAKEWLVICERPDLMRRVDIGDITINNYYVCETHFPNQILDYATRKILIKTAKPLTVAELKAMPAKSRRKGEAASKIRRHSEEYDVHIEDGFDEDDYDLEESNGEDGFSAFTNIDDLKNSLKLKHTFGVKIAKAEGNYHADLLEPLAIHEEDSYTDTLTRAPYCWTPEATRLLIQLRAERNADFEQSGARKSQLWLEICNKMREEGYDFTAEKASKKWHNITITYQKNAEKDPSSVVWEFFHDMHKVFKHKKLHEENSVDYSEPDIEPLPQQNGTTKRKLADMMLDDGEAQSPHSEQNYRTNVRESRRIKQRRLESEENAIDINAAFVPGTSTSIDESWWKNYFERKLELERQRLEKEEERHKERMSFQKMAILSQERWEKIKVDAMNNLTNALLRLQESGKI